MKYLTPLVFCLSLYAGLLNAAEPVVAVKIGSAEFTFAQRPRLNEVLAPVAMQQAWYWPASQLYRLESPQLAQQRAEALAVISNLALKADAELQPLLQKLANELNAWQLAEKIPLTIDYDLARAKLAFNPLFENGRYQLQLTTRPNDVYVWGAVSKNITLPLLAASAVEAYLPSVTLHSQADPNRVFIIQPDGKVIESLRGAWNTQRLEIMPGATIYIPFAEGYFSNDFAELNKKLLALAVNRIY